MTVTKMHNIAGISTTESQKASDLFMKCQYLDEITGARGVTFAVLEGLLNMNDKDIVTDTEPEQQCQTDNRQRGQGER